jgi:hypothetical protein
MALDLLSGLSPAIMAALQEEYEHLAEPRFDTIDEEDEEEDEEEEMYQSHTTNTTTLSRGAGSNSKSTHLQQAETQGQLRKSDPTSVFGEPRARLTPTTIANPCYGDVVQVPKEDGVIQHLSTKVQVLTCGTTISPQ